MISDKSLSTLAEFIGQTLAMVDSLDPSTPGGLARRVEQMKADGRFVDNGNGTVTYNPRGLGQKWYDDPRCNDPRMYSPVSAQTGEPLYQAHSKT